jgi:hypothetical protein
MTRLILRASAPAKWRNSSNKAQRPSASRLPPVQQMNAATLPSITDPEPDGEPGALRQWTCFPKSVHGHGHIASPQTFRLLVESAGGRLAIATLMSRTEPDLFLAANLARILDERPFALASRERISGEFEARHGVTVELLDIDLDKDDPIELTAALPRAIARAARDIASTGSTKVSLPELRASVMESIEREWLTTRSAFIARLDPDAVAQARAIDGVRPSTYGYLNTTSAVQQRNRAQAMTIFPLLRPVMMTPQFDGVRTQIDEGHPLIDVLALHYQATKAMIRALRGVTPEDLGGREAKPVTVLKLLREIPPSWWPRDPATWRQFANAVTAISRVSRHPITTAANQLWLRRAAQNGYQLSETTPDDLLRLGQDIDEFMDTLRRALIWALPPPQNQGSPAPVKRPVEIAAALKAGLGLDKLCHVVRRFGDAYRRALTEFAEEAELWRGVRWPALDGRGEHHAFGDILIYPLLTPSALTEEGLAMENCVSSYVEECMKGKSQIWSVRLRHDIRGDIRLSTLETRVRTHPSGRKVLHIEQHKGVRNGPPAELAWQAVRTFTARFSDYPEQMQSYLTWKATISRKPLAVRQRHALMLPIVTAFERTLPGKWSWKRLIEMGSVGKENLIARPHE